MNPKTKKTLFKVLYWYLMTQRFIFEFAGVILACIFLPFIWKFIAGGLFITWVIISFLVIPRAKEINQAINS